MAVPNTQIGHLQSHPVPGDGSCLLHSFNLNVIQGIIAEEVTKSSHPELYAWFRQKVFPKAGAQINADVSFKEQLTQLLSRSYDLNAMLQNIFMPAMRECLSESLMNSNVQRSLEAKILPAVMLIQNIHDSEQGILPDEDLQNKLARQGQLSFEDWETIANDMLRPNNYEGVLAAMCLEERFGVSTYSTTISKETGEVNYTNISQYDGAPRYSDGAFSLQVRRTGAGIGAHYEPCFTAAEQQSVSQAVRTIQQPRRENVSHKNASSQKVSFFFDRSQFEKVHRDTFERIESSNLSDNEKVKVKSQIENDYKFAVQLDNQINSPRP